MGSHQLNPATAKHKIEGTGYSPKIMRVKMNSDAFFFKKKNDFYKIFRKIINFTAKDNAVNSKTSVIA